MPILYLRADLFKADSTGPMLTVLEGQKDVPKKDRMSPEQRVKPTKMAETPRTMGGAYMRDVGSAKNREPYHCVGEGAGFKGKGCGVKVHPGGMEHIEDVPGGDPHRVMTAIEQGAEYARKTETGHLVEHPPKLEVTSRTHPERQKELGPPGHIEHLKDTTTTVRGAGKGGSDVKQINRKTAVSAEHIDRKLCPDCHERLNKRTFVASARGRTPEEAKAKLQARQGWSSAKQQAGLKKALELLEELLLKAEVAEGAPTTSTFSPGRAEYWQQGGPVISRAESRRRGVAEGKRNAVRAAVVAKEQRSADEKHEAELEAIRTAGPPKQSGSKADKKRVETVWDPTPKAKQGKEKRVRPPWRKSRLFLDADLFKSDASMFLRSDLVRSVR